MFFEYRYSIGLLCKSSLELVMILKGDEGAAVGVYLHTGGPSSVVEVRFCEL